MEQSIDVQLNVEDMVSMIKGANAVGDIYFFRKFIDDWYFKMDEEMRLALFDLVVKVVYGKCFTANPILVGTDKLFLARYNPNTQVSIEYRTCDGEIKTTTAFTSEGQYYVSSFETIPKNVIVKTEYL